MIELHGLTKRFPDKPTGFLAVDDLSFKVREGEIFGLLGPNGAGKTTTIRMLACLISPTSGGATIAGLDIGKDNDQIRQKIGILTESPGLYDRLSARKNLEIYGHLYNLADTDLQVEKYLKLFELWDRRDSPAGSFSKGMKQKLALARALLHDPPVLYLDEPTSGLDPAITRTVREYIEDLRSQKRTIILTTHNLDEAERLCDRIGVLSTHLVAIDTPEALRRQLFGRRVLISLKNLNPQNAETYLAHLQALSFVSRAETQDGQIVVSVANPEQDNPELVRTLVNAGGEVQFVTELKHSLEDVYLSLLHEEL
ncbi:MAG: ABC transporter ATP-binding protein [Chloroflexi bacterium]|nr:ABC transporter ATP-binding protein [Chloroflexota bacterium]